MLVKGPRHGIGQLGSLKKCWHDGYDGWASRLSRNKK
uniref:Uncharacterized protein n=1 Tax=Anguilla anguilla TaxID=7936 RepID=A0A0E9TLD3_ANGAN